MPEITVLGVTYKASPHLIAAKGFGQVLNFNCCFIVFPILRALLRSINNFQITPTMSVSRFLPLTKNLDLHKLVAGVVGFSTVGHMIAHFANHAESAKAMSFLFEAAGKDLLWLWISGSIIALAMFFIYSGAQETVKRANYLIFWWSHHCFTIFFLVRLPSLT